ncbi:putative acetyltransferase [Stigmatella aurantiaca]|uniref:Putative acetyltransferase n=1 Tax=Stigmatella aurantiaca TaxID=41 RepID=A0A1H7YBP4_STIAU|nr:GNAT family N-acetyltransferase [Stigmatella aurantiaca]SEM42748.1 putative acetyltransferase [Stigmatella aurantiaca]
MRRSPGRRGGPKGTSLPPLHVEACATPDPALLLELQLRAIRHHGGEAYGPSELSAWCDAAREDAEAGLLRGFQTYVAHRGGHLVGYGCFSGEDGLIGALYVEGDQMGQGVGTALLAALEAAALAQRMRTLYVHASLNAVPFYRRRGFTALASNAYELPSGLQLAMVRMVKDLGG